jgi:hypothetical protein
LSGSKRQTIETWLAALEARLLKPTPEPIPPEAAAAFHDAALAVHKRTGSTQLAKRAGLLGATAVAADLAAGLPARPRFAIGGEPTVEGRDTLDQLLTDVGWDPADPPRPHDGTTAWRRWPISRRPSKWGRCIHAPPAVRRHRGGYGIHAARPPPSGPRRAVRRRFRPARGP